jgi:hypothetical protein
MGRGPDIKKGKEKKEVKPGFAQFVFTATESLPIQ